MLKNTKKASDLTFIGSGISASFTLINFLDQVQKNSLREKISINIIDKYPEFNTGIPYSSRSGFSTLLITSLKNFLPEPVLSKFIVWLNKNKDWLLNEFEEQGGVLSKKWLETHKDNIDNNDWKTLFLPRRFFGCYINERVNTSIKLLEAENKIKVQYIHSEVLDLSKTEDDFIISLNSGESFISKKVILSVGSLPAKNLWKDSALIEEKQLMFFNTPYKPELNATLEKIRAFTTKRKAANKKTNVLIIGANASALEVLYKLNDVSGYCDCNFVFLSTQGKIPDAEIDINRKNEFSAINLNKLQRKSSLTAKDIAEAAHEDIAITDEIKLGAASTVDTISSAFGSLLTKLEYNELKRFACYYGNKIGEKQRCAGVHYTNTTRVLKKEGRFSHIAGRFIDLEPDSADEHSLKYLDTETSNKKVYDEKFHLVLNCTGGMDLTRNNIPMLLHNLIEKDYCKVNESKIGFEVNNSLEASNNLHIMGPLLAGNVINNNAVWHVEHCGRIIWLSGMLSNALYDSFQNEDNKKLSIPTGNNNIATNQNNHFEVITDKKEWDALLEEISCYDFYHTYDYHKLSASNGENPILIKYIENNLIIALPLLIRDIYSTIYKDATSVYGYVGPISNGAKKDFNNTNFIHEMRKYFNKHNIISVFSRLNPYISNQDTILSGHGELVSQGKVVNIDIKLSLDDQRSNYRSRYKTYINKARRECSIIEGNTEDDLKIFIELYYENMDRVNANKYYYFKKSYFQKIIKSNNFKTTFLFVVENKSKKIIGASMFIATNSIVQYHLSGTKNECTKLNPTKLLIDEMRIRATKQGYDFFNLGGGLGGRDDDPLFNFKSSFSKDFKDFNLWKWVTNEKIYNKLISDRESDNVASNYFPLYRSIEDINVQL